MKRKKEKWEEREMENIKKVRSKKNITRLVWESCAIIIIISRSVCLTKRESCLLGGDGGRCEML